MNIFDLKKRLIAGNVEYVYQILSKHFTNNIDDPLYYQFQTLESDYLNARKSSLTLTGQWQSKFLDILDDMDELDLDAHQAGETSNPRKKRKKRSVLIGMLCALSIGLYFLPQTVTGPIVGMGVASTPKNFSCQYEDKHDCDPNKEYDKLIQKEIDNITNFTTYLSENDKIREIQLYYVELIEYHKINQALRELNIIIKENSHQKIDAALLSCRNYRVQKDFESYYTRTCNYDIYDVTCNKVVLSILELIKELEIDDIDIEKWEKQRLNYWQQFKQRLGDFW